MKRLLLGCLLIGLAACNRPAEVPLTHQHEAAYQRQVQLLQAERVSVTAPAAPGKAGPHLLAIEVLNPQHQPELPDTLRQRVRKLAHLVVVDVANPAAFEVVSVQVTYKHGFFLLPSTTSQTFIYPLAGLR